MVEKRRIPRVFFMFAALASIAALLLSACAGSSSGGSGTNTPSKGITPAPSEVSNIVYSMPSWWNGKDCNKGVFPASYDLEGYDANNSPVTWKGIEACGPMPGLNGTGPLENFHSYGAGIDQYMWQCTELVARYLWMAYHLPSQKADGYQLVDAYTTNMPDSGFHKVDNMQPGPLFDRTLKIAPEAGDILSYEATSTNGYFGHTDIVTNASIDSSGNGYIDVLQQNMPWNGKAAPTDQLPVFQWVIQPSPHGAGTVQSWMTRRQLPNPNGGTTPQPTATNTPGVQITVTPVTTPTVPAPVPTPTQPPTATPVPSPTPTVTPIPSPSPTSTPSPTPTPPPSDFTSGTWIGQGTYNDGRPPFDMTLAVTVNGTTFSGTLIENIYNTTVTITGTVNGNTINFTDPSYVSGNGITLNTSYTGTVSNGVVSGTWVFPNPSDGSGTFTLSFSS